MTKFIVVRHGNSISNIDKTFTCHLPKEEALKIVSEEEYEYLINLTK